MSRQMFCNILTKFELKHNLILINYIISVFLSIYLESNRDYFGIFLSQTYNSNQLIQLNENLPILTVQQNQILPISDFTFC